MNVFILNTGRCGSTTFIKACSHIANYTSGHETRCAFIGSERLNYPPDHIEADNRLSWFLGKLDQKYGDNAFYVHLTRNRKDTAESFSKRMYAPRSIISVYRESILMGNSNREGVCEDYYDTVNANIELFLKYKNNRMPFSIETAKTDFEYFWKLIGAEGDLVSALKEFDINHNASGGIG